MIDTVSYKNDEYLHILQKNALEDSCECVVGGVVINDISQVFLQKRASDRKLFSGCWDIVGGHVEIGETIREALAREIREETGWELKQIVCLIDAFDWSSENNGTLARKREFDFVVEVQGNLENPQIERDKFTEYCWADRDDLESMKQGSAHCAMVELAQKGLELRMAMQLNDLK
jgi:mutator protein MutT